jgi:hypothetical protein
VQSRDLFKISLDTEATHGIVSQKNQFWKTRPYSGWDNLSANSINKQWDGGVPDLEQYERELHKRMMDIECELLGEELERYDVSAEQIEVKGDIYRPILTLTETYLSGAGPITVERHLYRPAGRGSKSICPLELRAGIVAGYFTPRAKRHS